MSLHFDLNMDGPVDGVLDTCGSMLDSVKQAMSRMAQEQRRMQDTINKLTRENHALRDENSRLKNNGGNNAGYASQSKAQVEKHDTHGKKAFQFQYHNMIHSAPVHSVKMFPETEVAASASWDGTVKLFDSSSREVVKTLGGQVPGEADVMGGLYAVAISKTQPHILGCTSCDKSVYLWDHKQGKMLKKLTGHTDEVNGIDFHSSQQVMATASDDGKVIIWDFQEGLTLRTLDKHTKQVYGVSFLGQEFQYLVATCCFDRQTRIYDMRNKEAVATLKTHEDDVIGIDFAPSRGLLATGSDDGLICLWNCKTWTLQDKITTISHGKDNEANEVKRVAFNPDGNLLAAACSSCEVLVYDINSPSAPLDTLGGHTDCVFDVSWAKCPLTKTQTLVSASHDHSCRYWKATTS